MTSSARRATVEVTVPPLEDAWKNWLSSNSHACAAWARNTVSTFAYWRRMPCNAKKKNCLARRRCASSIEPETSSAKITAALVAGEGRRTSWRKRRSSFTSEIGSPSAVVSLFVWIAWRFTASFMVRRRSRRERAPRLSQPSRTYSFWSMVAGRLGLSSGSFSSSHSQSTISSTLSSTTKRISPSPVPPCWPCASPSSRPGCKMSPGSPLPWPAPCCTCASERRKRACSRNLTGTATVRLPGRVIRSEFASSSGSVSFTASRTFSLWRGQSRAPLEKRSYQGVSAAMRMVTSFLREEGGDVVQRFARAVRVVAVLVHQPLLHHRYLMARLIVGARRRGDQPQHVAPALEEILLDRVVQRRMRIEGELLAALVRAHGLPHHLLAEGQLARLGYANLLLDRAQEALGGLALLVGDRVAQRAVVERRLDLIEILVEDLLRFLLEGDEERLVHVLLDPAVVEVLAHHHEEVDPLALLLAVHAHVGLDRVFQRDENIHGGEALRLRLDDGVGERVDHEARRHAPEPLVGVLGADLFRLGRRDAFDILARIEAHLLHVVGVPLFRLSQPGQDREHPCHVQRVRVEVHFAERLSGRAKLAIDTRLFLIVERVRDLDDDHPVEERLVLRLLQELAELGEVGVRHDRLVDVDQREARHLDVLLLGERQEQVQEFSLHLQDLDHLEKAPARGEYRARPRPGARVALVAELRDLRQVDGADEVGNIRGGRIVRRISADADARGLRDEDALHRHLHEVAVELQLQAGGAERAELARDLDAVGLAELWPQRVRDEVQRRLVHRAAVYAEERASVGLAVRLHAALEENHHARLTARGRPEQQQEPSANFRSGARRLEVVDDARDRVIDAVELVFEQLAAETAVHVVEAVGAQHVPDVLVARARDALRVGGEYALEEFRQRAAPARGAMILGEFDERLEKIRMPLSAPALHRRICIHDHHSFVRARVDPLAARAIRFVTGRWRCIRHPIPDERAERRSVDPAAGDGACGDLVTIFA